MTSGRALFPLTLGAAPHDWIQITGGAIGHGFPAATGAAVACPGPQGRLPAGRRRRHVLAAGALDPGARKARRDQRVFANRRYAILQGELAAVGAQPGPASKELFDLSRPEIRWTRLAEGMGVEAARVETLEGFADAFTSARARRGPFLIEFLI